MYIFFSLAFTLATYISILK